MEPAVERIQMIPTLSIAATRAEETAYTKVQFNLLNQSLAVSGGLHARSDAYAHHSNARINDNMSKIGNVQIAVAQTRREMKVAKTKVTELETKNAKLEADVANIAAALASLMKPTNKRARDPSVDDEETKDSMEQSAKIPKTGYTKKRDHPGIPRNIHCVYGRYKWKYTQNSDLHSSNGSFDTIQEAVESMSMHRIEMLKANAGSANPV